MAAVATLGPTHPKSCAGVDKPCVQQVSCLKRLTIDFWHQSWLLLGFEFHKRVALGLPFLTFSGNKRLSLDQR